MVRQRDKPRRVSTRGGDKPRKVSMRGGTLRRGGTPNMCNPKIKNRKRSPLSSEVMSKKKGHLFRKLSPHGKISEGKISGKNYFPKITREGQPAEG